MGDIAWLNGEYLPLEQARVPVTDRGFLFGDGVYEVVRGYGGRLFAFGAHWARLARSLHEIGIGGVDLTDLEQVAVEAVRRSGHAEPLLYLQITRGCAPRRHTWSDDLKPTVLLTVTAAQPVPRERLEAGVACITHPDWRWARCDIKSLNLLPNVMAKQRAAEAGAFEAILYEADGTVTEGCSTTLFTVTAGALATHPEGPRILPGITRSKVVELAEQLGTPVRLVPSHVLSLHRADEVFIAGTTTEIQPVVQIDGEAVHDGRPGPVTQRLGEAFEQLIAGGVRA